MTSRQWTYDHTSTPVFHQTLLAAAEKVHFKDTQKATLAGTVVQAPTFINDTKEGMEIKPIVGLYTHLLKSKQKGPVSGVKMTVDSGQEVMAPSVLAVHEVLTEGSSEACLR
jgi:hypothetical protein